MVQPRDKDLRESIQYLWSLEWTVLTKSEYKSEYQQTKEKYWTTLTLKDQGRKITKGG